MNNRWTILLEIESGNNYIVLEVGFGGRTTVLNDPMLSGRKASKYLEIAYRTHDIIIMQGSNDAKDVFNASAEMISWCLEKLVRLL